MTGDIFGGGSNVGANPGAAVGGSTEPGLDMDSLFTQQVDQDQVRKIEADSLKPVGTYTTAGLTMVAEREGPLDYQGNPNPRKGRPVFRYFGAGVMVVDEKTAAATKAAVGTEVKGFFTVRISPERHSWDDGSPDTQSRLWVQAVKAYQVATKDTTPSVGQVVEFLRDYPVRLRVIQKNTGEDAKGQPRNDVVAISAVKE